MRFEKPVPKPKAPKSDSSSSTKRKYEEVDEDGDTKMGGYSENSSGPYDEKIFFLGGSDKPTANRPTWRYRWRGAETGEGEIQVSEIQ